MELAVIRGSTAVSKLGSTAAFHHSQDAEKRPDQAISVHQIFKILFKESICVIPHDIYSHWSYSAPLSRGS